MRDEKPVQLPACGCQPGPRACCHGMHRDSVLGDNKPKPKLQSDQVTRAMKSSRGQQRAPQPSNKRLGNRERCRPHRAGRAPQHQVRGNKRKMCGPARCQDRQQAQAQAPTRRACPKWFSGRHCRCRCHPSSPTHRSPSHRRPSAGRRAPGGGVSCLHTCRLLHKRSRRLGRPAGTGPRSQIVRTFQPSEALGLWEPMS